MALLTSPLEGRAVISPQANDIAQDSGPEETLDAPGFDDRVKMGLCVDYVLRLMRNYTEMTDGDPTRALVLLAVTRAGTQHLNEPREGLVRGFIGDEQRRSVSIAALARSLALPAETVRRHIHALVSDGYVSASKGGVVVLAKNLDKPAILAAMQDSRIALQRLERALKPLSEEA